MPIGSRKKIAVFSSGEGSTMTKIHKACQRGNLPAEILLIISNKAHSGAIERAKRHAIDSYLFDTGNNEDTIKTESDLVGLLKQSKIDWILLLGYTRKIGPKLLTAFNNRIINTHPSLLPKYGGKGFYGRKIHEAVLASGDILTGATVHLVNEEYDSGEILSQIAVPVLPKDSATTLEARVKKTEKAHLIKVLNELWKNNN
tara:strand:+ start:341 stop:943 length:603 start_codon:yes stop_codon:yes gene_type:complete